MVEEINPSGAAMRDVERKRIFVTMNATFKNEEKCRVAMETIVNDAHAAYGVTSHFWFRSTDGRSLFVVEQYADESALRQAVRRFTSARVSFFRSIKQANVSVYGDVSFGIKLMFSVLWPRYMKYFSGYSKDIGDVDGGGIKDFERKRVFVATNATFRDAAQGAQAVEALAESTYAEPGTKSYFSTSTKEGADLFVVEQYADEQALVDHLAGSAALREAVLASVDVKHVTIYGAQSDEVEAMFAPLNPTSMDYYGGYSK